MTGIEQKPRTVSVLASGAADAERVHPGDLAAVFETIPSGTTSGGVRFLRFTTPEDAPGRVIDRRGCILTPGFVNAHTHLDLTNIGPRPHDPARGFVPWVEMVRAERPATPEAIEKAVRRGIALSLAGGVVAVGDILGAPAGRPTTAALRTLADSPLRGVGFVEFFGIGNRADTAIAMLEPLADELTGFNRETGGRFRAGLQPHAPNTVSLGVYRVCAHLAGALGLPVSTHLAETAEERRFIAEAAGPQRAMLERLGIWDDRELAWIGRGRHSVEHLARVLGEVPFLLAHVNDADDAAIDTIAESGSSVAYCPRASAYFGAPGVFGQHRYWEMLARGVNVCLGTDSIVNLDTRGRISVLDEARLLARRDGAPAQELLTMMTTRGASALGLDPALFRFIPGGPMAGVVATPGLDDGGDPAAALMAGNGPPELVLCDRIAIGSG